MNTNENPKALSIMVGENGEVSDEVNASHACSNNISSMEKGSHLEQRNRKFRSYLRWVFVDQSNVYKAVLSWSVFITLTFIVPIMLHFLFHCPKTCDADHRRPYYIPAQVALSVLSTLSFFCLARWDRKYGLSEFLFVDKLNDGSLKIEQQMQVCFLCTHYL